MIITSDEFYTLITPLLGMPVSMPWRGYGSALFLELGKLTPPSNIRLKHPKGEACVYPGWEWRIESNEKIICGSCDSRPEIEDCITCLCNLRVNAISIDGSPSELIIHFSDGLRLRSMAMTSGYPQWDIRLPDGTYLLYEKGSLVRKRGDEASGLSPEEIEVMNLGDKASERWGKPLSEPLSGNCTNCNFFVRLDGHFALIDYGVCVAADSPFDGRVVYIESGCRLFLDKSMQYTYLNGN